MPNPVYSTRNHYVPRYGRPPPIGRNEIEPPPDFCMAGTAAAGGIALINSIGNLAGFVAPYMIGALKTSTGT